MSTFSFRLVYKPHCLRNSYFLLSSTIIWLQFHYNEWPVSFSLLWMTYLDECHVSIRMPVQPWTLEDDALDLSRKMCRFLYMIVVWCVATVGPTCRCPVMLWDTPHSHRHHSALTFKADSVHRLRWSSMKLRAWCSSYQPHVVVLAVNAFPVSLLERLERAQTDVTVEHVTNVLKSMFILNWKASSLCNV